MWSCFVLLAGAATSIIFVATKVVLCCDKSMLVATKLLSRQTYSCCKKTFVATNICRDKHIFVVTICCCDKLTFVTTKHVFCRDKSMLVRTTKLSQQKNIVATNVLFVQQKFCCSKHTFVMTKDVFCYDKHMFVMTKMILVAAPANDTFEDKRGIGDCLCLGLRDI